MLLNNFSYKQFICYCFYFLVFPSWSPCHSPWPSCCVQAITSLPPSSLCSNLTLSKGVLLSTPPDTAWLFWVLFRCSTFSFFQRMYHLCVRHTIWLLCWLFIIYFCLRIWALWRWDSCYYSQIYAKDLEQCLAYTKCSANICWQRVSSIHFYISHYFHEIFKRSLKELTFNNKTCNILCWK